MDAYDERLYDKLADYEEYHESRQELKDSEREPVVCPYGNREDCPYFKGMRQPEAWGIEYEFECHHPHCDSDECPLNREEEEGGGE